jgi:hypothetical protein
MRLTARLVLLVMLATFLSPSFAWHMHAGHHEIEHSPYGQPHDHDQDHDGNTRADGEVANDAHASIGHLLGHLAMQLCSFQFLLPVAERFAPHVDAPVVALTAVTSPPYRPPL